MNYIDWHNFQDQESRILKNPLPQHRPLTTLDPMRNSWMTCLTGSTHFTAYYEGAGSAASGIPLQEAIVVNQMP